VETYTALAVDLALQDHAFASARKQAPASGLAPAVGNTGGGTAPIGEARVVVVGCSGSRCGDGGDATTIGGRVGGGGSSHAIGGTCNALSKRKSDLQEIHKYPSSNPNVNLHRGCSRSRLSQFPLRCRHTYLRCSRTCP
jgi:hypothetical protein